MKKKMRAIGGLVAGARMESSIALRAKGVLLEISVVAEDLFRIRTTQAKKFSTVPSWAVAKTEWSAGKVTSKVTKSFAELATAKGRLRVKLADGAWELTDANGRVCLSAPGSVCGFEGAAACVGLALREDEAIFGLGETSNTFNKRGLIREFWNIDVLGHASAIHPSLRRLYVSIPFGISLLNGKAAAVFWDNPGMQRWDLGQTEEAAWRMKADRGEIDLYLFCGPSVQGITERFTELTGRMPMPPQWALGYQQSRYSYQTRARVEELAATFREKKIPCDVVHLDIHHMRDYRVFTFGKTFKQPAQLLAKLKAQGFKVVTIVDPGVKDDPKFGVRQRGRKGRHFVKRPKGTRDMIAKVWPGLSRFPDFFNAKTRQWWGKEQEFYFKLGVAGIWNDMNEPAAFDLPGKTLPDECPHVTDHGIVRHGAVHNAYGMQMARASREGALAYAPDLRPFVISRAGYAGVQRHALVWTGDNSSTWEHLAESVPMLLNLSLSGVAFCGADAGGFLDSATGELLARWTQLAAFTPFFRNHTNLESRAQEPWSYGKKIEDICRDAIELRYRLLPYLYALFAEAHRNGTPIMRPLFWHYQDDPQAVAAGDQFLLGRDILVAPILRQGGTARSVYLPRGDWWEIHSGEKIAGGRQVLAEAGLERMPIYVRAGAIIPMIEAQQYVGQKTMATVELHVWPRADGELNWYEDDGVSMGHLKGAYAERVMRFEVKTMELVLGPVSGAYVSEVKRWRVMVRGGKTVEVVNEMGEIKVALRNG